MITVQVHRLAGPDEDLEFETEREALAHARRELMDPDVRRVVVIAESGRIIDDLVDG